MIPKIIHYCWFGKGKYPSLLSTCIETWHKTLHDFEFVCWNEDTFDIDSIPFVKKAYEDKKWAFVSDYARLKALYDFGGVYLDTDIEIIKDFSSLLSSDLFFTSYTEGGLISTSFICCPPKHPFIKLVLDYYENSFWKENGTYIMNTLIFSKIANLFFSVPLSNKFFSNGFIQIFPAHYFSPFKKNILLNDKKKYRHNNYVINDKTYVIHHDFGSWSTKRKLSRIISGLVRIILPLSLYNKIKILKNRKRINYISYHV